MGHPCANLVLKNRLPECQYMRQDSLDREGTNVSFQDVFNYYFKDFLVYI